MLKSLEIVSVSCLQGTMILECSYVFDATIKYHPEQIVFCGHTLRRTGFNSDRKVIYYKGAQHVCQSELPHEEVIEGSCRR